MSKKIELILKEVLKRIEPSNKDLKIINESLNEFKEKIRKRINKLKLDVNIFEGGSFAKKTIIKKDIYDIDLFIRFDEKYKKENISRLTEKLLKNFKNVYKIHGSRDYFSIKKSSDFFIELIPVIKVEDPKKAENITDLSYSHVKYINKKIKTKRILDDIKIAKAFCYATNTYGAESYISGFSGYSVELLIYFYGSFIKFLKEMIKHKNEKIIIDIEKDYKTRQNILFDINTSKLNSPIILVDPTYKQRNVLAALSEETFEKFKKCAKKFLKNPSIKDFEIKKINLEKIKKSALTKRYEYILLQAKTSKQEGAIAGSKLLKFYKHLENEIRRFFEIKNKGFIYDKKKSSKMFFVTKKRPESIIEGPFLEDKNNVIKFKKHHKNTFNKSRKIYAKEKVSFNLNDFIIKWKEKYKKKIKEMSINEFKLTSPAP